MDWKPYEPTLHRLGGFLTEAVNLRLFWFWRERRQLPPENDEFPVAWVDFNMGTAYKFYTLGSKGYWSKTRVLDMLKDLEEAAQGGTVGWLWPLAFGVLIGWGIWG